MVALKFLCEIFTVFQAFIKSPFGIFLKIVCKLKKRKLPLHLPLKRTLKGDLFLEFEGRILTVQKIKRGYFKLQNNISQERNG